MTALTSPGQLAANLPGILGFYPHDSVVFAAFEATCTGSRFRLGPVIRLDIDDLRHLPDVARSLEESGPELIFAFVITGRGEDEVEEIVDTLMAMVRTAILPIHACWVAREILTGEPVQLAFGPAPRPGEDPWSGDWRDDVIAPVAQAQAMGPLLANGMLPDLNREESFEQFSRFNPAFSTAECELLSDFVHRHARGLPAGLANGRDETWRTFSGVATDVELLLGEIEEQELTVADLMSEEATLLTIGTMLGTSTVRDLVMEDLLRQPAPASRLLLAAARTFDGTVRSNALAIYALCVLELGLSMRAMPALSAVLVDDPRHSLTLLLLGACRSGAFDTLLRAVREGSRQVRAEHGVTDGADFEAA